MDNIPGFDTALVPMQLEAFVLNPAVCSGGARISPITQPNYTFLRLDNFLIQADVQNQADLHATAPADINSRMTDLGARPPKALRHRHGVYLHWMLPRFYRYGLSTGKTVPEERRRRERLRHGLPVGAGDGGTNDTPDFVQPPTRWVVVREIMDLDKIEPADARKSFQDKKYQAWVIESDHLWSLDQIPLDLDLQTDMAPFVMGREGPGVNIEEQAEFFIGRKTPLEDWSGVEDPEAQPPSLSLLSSGNQLFADFQMHNANVFSVLDNFRYGDDKDPKYLTKATCSYYVLGWHWKQDVDPLWNSGKSVTHGASLDALLMTLLGVKPDDPWLDQKSQLRALCHGAMYDVKWDYANKPQTVPADGYSERLQDQKVPSISVGTTPMDALISYCTARKAKRGTPADIPRLEEDILAIESLLHARDDGIEGQREAKDTMYTWAFSRSPAGTHYHFSGPDESQAGSQAPLKPSDEAIKALKDLNETQTLLDACSSTALQYRWDMFSAWWKYVSDVSNKDDPERNREFKRLTDDISARLEAMQLRIDNLKATIHYMLHPEDPREKSENLLATAKPASQPVFYLSKDPTLLIGGVESGWPLDYLDKISIRAPFQVITSSTSLPQALQDLMALVQRKLPDVFRSPAASLLAEFCYIQPGGSGSGQPPSGQYYPQFHDTKTSDGRWRDRWGDRQPWFPLYAEWEIEYTHIPFTFWKLDEHTARLSASELVRYGISVPAGKPPQLWDALPKPHDTRVLSGRVLILPQPSFSLQAKVKQLFDTTPPAILDQYLEEPRRKELLENMNKLFYLSSTLTGLNNGLTTRAEGSHIKPENKTVGPDGDHSSAMAAAAFDDAGLTLHNINLIQNNSALTPYASLANFLGTDFCPFKPVTHGQFRFRKLNIIDKFGQSLMVIDQAPRLGGPPPMYPAISDFYEPQTIKLNGQEYANTVLEQKPALCEFLQLPMQINQNARLNAHFVQRTAQDAGSPKAIQKAAWRPATEWEMPIWGWVITNYADSGIQIFLPDGTFYREVRWGGPLGAMVTPKWMPFAPDKDSTDPGRAQLDALVEKLTDPGYLNGFWHMITTAQDNLPPAPSAYAQFLNSIVGKPLALVNMGWSLELDRPPLTNQSTKSTVMEPERMLTKPPEGDSSDYYQFQVRLGNKESEYDGLVGYFDMTTPTSDELNLDYINTFFTPSDPDKQIKPLRRLDTTSYPLFTAFWQPPFPTERPYDDRIKPPGFSDQRNAKMSVFGAIVDPFTPVHAYSSFLPPVALSLPPWTWQSAMDTMTAFFHAGPLTLPIQHVPEFKKDEILTSKNSRDMPKRDLQLPALAAGDWSWFQPYQVSESPAARDNDPPVPVFNPFGIEKRGDLLKPGFQNGPYTAIEGFLQLRHPIMMPKGKPEGNPA